MTTYPSLSDPDAQIAALQQLRADHLDALNSPVTWPEGLGPTASLVRLRAVRVEEVWAVEAALDAAGAPYEREAA